MTNTFFRLYIGVTVKFIKRKLKKSPLSYFSKKATFKLVKNVTCDMIKVRKAIYIKYNLIKDGRLLYDNI